jgi:hypothetical protein
MADLQKLKAEVLADGRIDEQDVEVICRELYPEGKIDREEVEFLIALRKEAESVCPVFEQFFFEAVKHCVLKGGLIDAKRTAWLRRVLSADGSLDEAARQFLREVRSEARYVSREFQELYDESLQDDGVTGG